MKEKIKLAIEKLNKLTESKTTGKASHSKSQNLWMKNL